MPDFGVNIGQNYVFEVNQTNVATYWWDFGGELGVQTSRSVLYSPISTGKKKFCVNLTIFGGVSKFNCFELYVYNNSGSGLPNKTTLYELSPEEENIGGVNYGRLISLNGQVWLTQDVSSGSTTGNTSPNQCPVTFRYFFIKMEV